MRVLSRSAILSCVVILLGGSPARAAERLIVVRGSHCPGGLRPTSAEAAAGSSATDCIVIDPFVQKRFGSGQASTMPASLCRQRIAEIESLGAVLCRLERPEPAASPAPEAAAPGALALAPHRAREHSAAEYVVRLLTILFRLVAAFVALTLMVRRRAKILARIGPFRYYALATLLSGSTIALVALMVDDRDEIIAVLHRLV